MHMTHTMAAGTCGAECALEQFGKDDQAEPENVARLL